MTNAVLEAVRSSFDRRMSVSTEGATTVVATAWTLEDGTPVTLFIDQVATDVFNVSDAGLAAGALADAGVDLGGRNVAGPSFQMVQQSLRLSPAVGEVGLWDLAVSVSGDDLGEAVLELSEAVIRSEGLKALGRRRAVRNFGDRIVKVAADVGLKIEPQARLPLRYRGASRRVTYRLAGGRRDVYLQSITKASAGFGYDHARAIFADADIARDRRVTAVEQGARLDDWQQEGLSEVCQVVSETGMPDYLEGLKAA